MPTVDLVLVGGCVVAAGGYLVWKLVLRSRPKAPPVKLGGALAAAMKSGAAKRR